MVSNLLWLDIWTHRGKTMWRHRGRRWPCDWHVSPSSQSLQTLEVTRMYSSLRPSQKAWPCWHLDFGLPSSRTKTINLCCFKTWLLDFVAAATLGNKSSMISAITGIHPSKGKRGGGGGEGRLLIFRSHIQTTKYQRKKERPHQRKHFSEGAPADFLQLPLYWPEPHGLSQTNNVKRSITGPWPLSLCLEPDGSDSPEVHCCIQKNGFQNKLRSY